ncbi:MAG: NAD(P)H-hydrate epimerase, partial [Rubrivivax sp.]|nr:NAD(P)H-hydrate epimerase [Rubrivivax sp.]
WPLHDVATSRATEAQALRAAAPGALMARAGLAVARLALALAPHARRVQLWCGPGNNGGDGLVAALHLHQAGCRVQVNLIGDANRLPPDAEQALKAAVGAGVPVETGTGNGWGVLDTGPADLVIDALLGLGASRAPSGDLAAAIALINQQVAPVLAVDLPSGLAADTGALLGEQAVRAHATLLLLTLKPGCFMHQGRDHCGEIWFDDLGQPGAQPTATLNSAPPSHLRPHHSHKGSHGDVWVVGGAHGMEGAAWLAAASALAAGAGRVYVSLLAGDAVPPPGRPELMVRPAGWLQAPGVLAASTVVCGCGGGDTVRLALPPLLSHAGRLVLDADALNALASDPSLQSLLRHRGSRGLPTLLTPHPLEAARLLDCKAAQVQQDRLKAAAELAAQTGATVLLKGSGSVV